MGNIIPFGHKTDRAKRKEALRTWLNSDPELRQGFLEMNPDLKALDAHVRKMERLAIGFREQADR